MAVIGDLVVRYGATTKGFDAGTRRVRGGLTSITKGVTRMITAMAPLAGGALFASMARNAEQFTRKMNQSLAIMGDVSEETQEKMSKAAFRVAKDTIFSAEQAAESYFFLASAGLSAEQSLAAIPVVAQFGQAGMFDMSRATDLLTDAQSALGLTVDDTAQNMKNMLLVSDVLVKANTLANASVQQFSEALTNKAGAALKIVNKDIEEGVAVLAAFADQGLKGSDAGTALNIVMRDLQTKALQNQEAFKEAGISVFNLSGDMNNMADIVGDLEDRLDGMSDAQKKATLLNLGFADKSVIFIQTIIGMSDKIREYEAELRKAGGTTKEVSDKQMTPFQKAMERLKAASTELGESFNENVLPSIVKFLDVVTRTLAVLKAFLPVIVAVAKAMIAYALVLRAVAAAQAFVTALSGPKGWLAVAGGIAVAAVAAGAMASQLNSIAQEGRNAIAIVEDLGGAGPGSMPPVVAGGFDFAAALASGDGGIPSETSINSTQLALKGLINEYRLLTGAITQNDIALQEFGAGGANALELIQFRTLQLGVATEKIRKKFEDEAKAMLDAIKTPQEKIEEQVRRIEVLAFAGAITPEERQKLLEDLKLDQPDAEPVREPQFAAALQAGTSAAFSGIVASLARTSGDKQKDIARNTELTAEEIANLNAALQQRIDNEPVPVNIDGAP